MWCSICANCVHCASPPNSWLHGDIFKHHCKWNFGGWGSQTYPLINQNLFLLLRICDQVHFISSENVKKTHSAPVSPTSANISSVVFHWKIQFSHSRTYEAVRVAISKDWHAQLKFWSQEPQQTYQEANIVKIPHQNYGSLVPGTFLLRREQVSLSVPQIQCSWLLELQLQCSWLPELQNQY